MISFQCSVKCGYCSIDCRSSKEEATVSNLEPPVKETVDCRSSREEEEVSDLETPLTETTLNPGRKLWQQRFIQMMLLMTGLSIVSIACSFQELQKFYPINDEDRKLHYVIKDRKNVSRRSPALGADVNIPVIQNRQDRKNVSRRAPFLGADVNIPVIQNRPLEVSPGCQDYRAAICKGYPIRKHCHRHQPEPPLIHAPGTNITQETCKTLWFSGFHQGKSSFCKGTIGGYRTDYARALGSATVFASDSLQPVLMLGGYRMNETDDEGAIALRRWAEERGTIVIDVPDLSFMEKPAAWLAEGSPSEQQGYFLRLDIPRLIREHNLFDLPNVCQKYVLYTDADVMFTNPISKQDMAGLKTFLNDETFIMYGREIYKHDPLPINTGVILFDVDKFEEEWPKILAFSDDKTFEHDQFWLNAYFDQDTTLRAKRAMLPMHWNWKAYWNLEPSSWEDIKIFHFHGPKIGKGFRHASNCDMDIENLSWIYQWLIKMAMCCDEGKTAYRVLQLDGDLSPRQEDVC